MARLDQDRQKELEPVRMKYARDKIEQLGFEINFQNEVELRFNFRGATVSLFPYSGWHSGKSITDGRGIDKLLNQIKS